MQTLRDINLEYELLTQYQSLSLLFKDTLADDAVYANQKASLANSLASLLEKITKLQSEVYSSERVKRLESVLLKTLQTTNNVELTVQFLENYEAAFKETFQPN